MWTDLVVTVSWHEAGELEAFSTRHAAKRVDGL
jgi:hypothetical protein